MNECQWACEVYMVQTLRSKRQKVIHKSLKEVNIIRLYVVPQDRGLVTVTHNALPPAVKLLYSKGLSAF